MSTLCLPKPSIRAEQISEVDGRGGAGEDGEIQEKKGETPDLARSELVWF